MDDKAYPVTELRDDWPQFYGKIGMRFIFLRIRHGSAWIGTGGSYAEAECKADLVTLEDSLAGVSGIDDAIRVLKKNGYRVKSIVVPEHIEELEA